MDRRQFAKLTDGERHFIEHVLAFFAGADGIVVDNLARNFCAEIGSPKLGASTGSKCVYS